jgi:hypothetical protein
MSDAAPGPASAGQADDRTPYGIAMDALEDILELDVSSATFEQARTIAMDAHALTFGNRPRRAAREPDAPRSLDGLMPMGLHFDDADPVARCLVKDCHWHAHGDAMNDAVLAWSAHLADKHRLDWPDDEPPQPAPDLGQRLGEAEDELAEAGRVIDNYRDEHRRLTADNERLRARIAELSKALGEAARHVEPVDQNSELAIGGWLELAKRETDQIGQFAQPVPELAAAMAETASQELAEAMRESRRFRDALQQVAKHIGTDSTQARILARIAKRALEGK